MEAQTVSACSERKRRSLIKGLRYWLWLREAEIRIISWALIPCTLAAIVYYSAGAISEHSKRHVAREAAAQYAPQLEILRQNIVHLETKLDRLTDEQKVALTVARENLRLADESLTYAPRQQDYPGYGYTTTIFQNRLKSAQQAYERAANVSK